MIFHQFSTLVSLLLFIQLTSISSFVAPTKSRTTFAMTKIAAAKPETGDIVTIDYELTPNDDFVPTPLFNTGNDISFSLNKGNYLPGLHTLVSTMEVGQSIENVDLDAGWGSRNQQLIATVPKEKDNSSGLDYDAIKVGTELLLASGAKCRVTAVTDADFTIDANPPLAGASYTASVSLKDVSKGPCREKYEYHPEEVVEEDSSYQVMTIALGCFWGGELEYMRVPGVVYSAVGYTQGDIDVPTYQQVCSGSTGHTEGIQVVFNPDIVSYKSLIKIGMERLGESRYLLNQVGNDRGTQYRHGVYYHNDAQKKIADEIIESYNDGSKKCMTEVLPAKIFYNAEDYHQQYLLKGGQSAKKNAKEVIRCYG